MAAEQSAQDGDATRTVRELSAASDPRRTPEESTAGLGSAAAPAGGAIESDVAPLQPGETLVGRFTVVRFLAQGGMGAVYEANDSVLRSRVALKLIRRRVAQDPSAMERFRREVLLARQVSHPNVCRVYELYEAATASGEPIQFLTMELLPGETLARRLAREGTLSTADALPLVQQMCAGLAAAHAEGVIHRDFKSSNVMLVSRADASGEPSSQGTRVAITDFGVARALSTSGGEDRLTGEAGVLGTPEYMAPEQVTGSEVTPATDIYALGVVLYELVTGKLPFVGDTPLAAAARRLNEAPPRPELAAPGLDARWAKAILRCLAREPQRRFRSALDVSEALGEAARRWQRPFAAAGLAFLLLAIGAFAGVRTVPRLLRDRAKAGAIAPRPVAAMLGIANGGPEKGLPWLSTAVEEGLHHELAAAEASLRALPTDRVAKARRSLGIAEDGLTEATSRSRLQGLLVANRLIYGDIAPVEPGSNVVQLRLHLLDGPTSQELASFAEELGPDASKLPEALPILGSKLRGALHASLTSEEETALSATRVKSLDAARAHAEGVLSFRAFDYPQARNFFQAALASEVTLVDAHRRLAETWKRQGFRKKAQQAAEGLAAQKHLLTPAQAAAIPFQVQVFGPDLPKRVEGRLALFNASPDDEELGLDAAVSSVTAQSQLALVRRLRQLPPPVSKDIRLDAAEAEAIWRVDPKHASELLDRFERRAKELGARSEQATAHEVRGSLVDTREALRLHSEVGDLEDVGRMMRILAGLANFDPPREALRALDAAAGVYRRLGNRWQLHELLAQSAEQWWYVGDIKLANKRLEEARSEAELLGEKPGWTYMWMTARLRCWNADLEGCRAAIRSWRAETEGSDTPVVLMFEAGLLREEDHLEEARVSWRRAGLLAEQDGGKWLSRWALGSACAVECEQGHPVEGIACLTALPAGAAGREPTLMGNLEEARCRYRSRDFSGAEAAARRTLVDVRPGDFVWHSVSSIEVSKAMAARGQVGKAVTALRKILAESESKGGHKTLAFEAALALGEAELAGGLAGGRPRLLRLEQEAKAKGYARIARLAREAIDRKRPQASAVSSVAR